MITLFGRREQSEHLQSDCPKCTCQLVLMNCPRGTHAHYSDGDFQQNTKLQSCCPPSVQPPPDVSLLTLNLSVCLPP
ncbi:hypothetical protein AALO_G00056040 [Alosa alosa]|uniref:Uncharacterized protein n=1 Tax=Alosa alosa TaxID=278164 RepID=A0AAV6H8R5_9TELE|nr:hypothetical protein AALO_G00056040 [Alosa alosa]